MKNLQLAYSRQSKHLLPLNLFRAFLSPLQQVFYKLEYDCICDYLNIAFFNPFLKLDIKSKNDGIKRIGIKIRFCRDCIRFSNRPYPRLDNLDIFMLEQEN